MKVAYLIGPTISGGANGVVSQATTWANGMAAIGHEVALINGWNSYNWKGFDIIHAFGYGTWLEIIPQIAARTHSKIVLSPIIDSERSHFFQKIGSHMGFGLLRMTSPLYALRSVHNHISKYYVRSEHEKEYLSRSFGVGSNLICKIPLSCRFKAHSISHHRDAFCLHVSILSSQNKNVMRLVEAAKTYGFRLVLAGSVGTDRFKAELEAAIRNNPNIEYLGFVTEEKLIDLYSKAKVFALPSLFEGVGLVALEAAAFGADIVLTNRGAPKEYYKGLAYLVDPASTESIGKAIVNVLNGSSHQPALSEFIVSNYNNERLIGMLEKSYLDLLGG